MLRNWVATTLAVLQAVTFDAPWNSHSDPPLPRNVRRLFLGCGNADLCCVDAGHHQGTSLLHGITRSADGACGQRYQREPDGRATRIALQLPSRSCCTRSCSTYATTPKSSNVAFTRVRRLAVVSKRISTILSTFRSFSLILPIRCWALLHFAECFAAFCQNFRDNRGIQKFIEHADSGRKSEALR